MGQATNPFRSARLLYRAVEFPEDDALFLEMQTTPMDFINSNASIKKPQAKKNAAEHQNYIAEGAMLGVVICLAPSEGQPAQSRPVPIGAMHLQPLTEKMFHHRHSEIGIDILPQYQGQGYGSEAIKWILKWAFHEAGLHRVGLRAFEYNHGARRLYERLGFKLEGTSRELIWHRGRYWNDYQYGMLQREWRETHGKDKENEEVSEQ